MKKILFLLMFVMMTISVFGSISEPQYTQIGSNVGNTASNGYVADYDTYGVTNYSFDIDTGDILSNEITPVVGQLDDDYGMEVVYPTNNGNTLMVIAYDQDLDSFDEKYSNNDYRIDSPIVLYDSDDDSEMEMFFCGVPDNTTQSMFIALEIDNGSISEKWRSQVGRTDFTAVEGMGCYITDGYDNLRQITKPICTGDYCYFTGICDSTNDNTCPQAMSHPNSGNAIYKFDINNGSSTSFNLRGGSYFSGEVKYVVANGGLIFPQNTEFSDSVKVNDDENTVVPAMCDIDEDGYQDYFLNVIIKNPSDNYQWGILAIDGQTMTPLNSFGSNGLVVISSTEENLMSSPSCYFRGDEYRIYEAIEVSTDNIELLSFEPDGSIHLTTGLLAKGDETSNIFFGEWNGDSSNQEACFISNDIGSNEYTISCSNINGLILNIMQKTFSYTGTRDLRFNVVTDSEGTDYNLAGTTSGEDVLTNFGILSGRSEIDGIYQYPTESLYNNYINGNCALADVNRDGYADITCINTTSIYFGISTNPNTQVDFKSYIPDVSGTTMCLGNQSFYVPSPTTGYTDIEENNVRLFVDCTDDGSYDNYTDFTGYGNNLTVYCNYNTSGTYTAKICMQDNIHPSDYSQCDFFSTTASNTGGCESPDSVYDIVDIQSDTDAGENETSGDDSLTYVSDDVSESFLNIIKSIGGTNQNSIDLIIIIIVCFIGGMIGMSGHPFVAIFISSMIITVTTIIGWLRPVYLLVTLIMIVFFMFIVKPLMSNSSGSG